MDDGDGKKGVWWCGMNVYYRIWMEVEYRGTVDEEIQ